MGRVFPFFPFFHFFRMYVCQNCHNNRRKLPTAVEQVVNQDGHIADAHIVADVHVATKGGRKRPKIKTNL